VQKLLGKIKYLQRFIANLAGKVESFLLLIQLKHEERFQWGDEPRQAFEKIKGYLVSPPVLQAPRVGKDFKLYIAVQERVIGAVLTKEDGGKEFSIAYLSQRLSDTEGRYAFIEKLCLSLCYACTKLRHYLLTRFCTVVCQYDAIKCKLQKSMLHGRLGKWAYSLIEYDLGYMPLKAMKGQVVVDIIVDHTVRAEWIRV
jgi:hypothetical protein